MRGKNITKWNKESMEDDVMAVVESPLHIRVGASVILYSICYLAKLSNNAKFVTVLLVKISRFCLRKSRVLQRAKPQEIQYNCSKLSSNQHLMFR
jgi:hypothetical protein